MKKLIALAALSTFALAACKDNTQAQLEQQQKQIEALQQQLAQQNGQQEDNTVYQLTPEAVKDTIPAEAQANGNNGQPVTGTDGQQYIYDQSTGSWLLQSLVGAAAGAFIGNALANKFTQARNQTADCPSSPYQLLSNRTSKRTHQPTAEYAHPACPTAKCATTKRSTATALPRNRASAFQLPPPKHGSGLWPPSLIRFNIPSFVLKHTPYA